MICPKCKIEVESLTKEHIIPKWLSNYDNCLTLGIVDSYYEWNEFNIRNIERICKICNSKKSGFLNYKNRLTRDFARVLANKILIECDKAEISEVILRPICQCGILHIDDKETHKETVREKIKEITRPTLDDIFGVHTNT